MFQKGMRVNKSDIPENFDSLNLLKTLKFCVIDLETTGGNQSFDKIIEIGLVKVEKLKITQDKNLLIDPEIPIPDFIQKLTSIKEKDIEGCPKIEEVLDEILEFIGDSILVAHNISFDIPFLNSVLRRAKRKELTNKVICTNVMTKYLIPEVMNSNLNYLCQLFDIKHQKAHRAKDDAKATAEILLNYLKIYIEKGIRKVNQLYYPKNKFELDRINFTKDDDLEKILDIIKNSPTPMTVSIKGEKGVMLSVIPIVKCAKEVSYVKKVLNTLEWEVITLKLMGPLLEGLLQVNLHINKFSDKVKEDLVEYLTKSHGELTSETDKSFLSKIDFVVTPHLIKEQLLCYSFLNLSNSTKLIFKYPGHKKKFYQYLGSQKKRFKTYQKEKKKFNINKELIPIFNNYMFNEFNNKRSHYSFISLDMLKKSEDTIFDMIDELSKKKNNLYQYPKKHL